MENLVLLEKYLENEEWKPVYCDNRYLCSNLGRIFSKISNRILKTDKK